VGCRPSVVQTIELRLDMKFLFIVRESFIPEAVGWLFSLLFWIFRIGVFVLEIGLFSLSLGMNTGFSDITE